MENALILCVDDIVKGIGNKEEGHYHGTLEWNKGCKVAFMLIIEKSNQSVTLNYNKDGIAISYNIPLESVKSNLGKGRNYYFICPFSELRCKKLYLVGNSEHFKHRKAYDTHLYYCIQTLSENDKIDYRLHKSAFEIENAVYKHPKQHYRNKTTRAQDMLMYKRYRHSVLVEQKGDQVLRMIKAYEKKRGKFPLKLD